MRFPKLTKISLLACMSLVAASPAYSSLIHYYTFEGDVTDQAGSVNGTLVGDATASGGTLTLDGSGDWVAFGSNFLVPTTGDFSVALFAQFSYDGNTHEFISQGNSGGPGFYIGPYGGEMRVTDNYGWTATPSIGGCCTGIATPTDGEWHHYAIVVTGTDAEFFIDGISRATRSGFSIGGAAPTVLGSQFGGGSELFNGAMRDVRIYDNALSNEAVVGLSAAPEPGSALLLASALAGVAFLVRRKRTA